MSLHTYQCKQALIFLFLFVYFFCERVGWNLEFEDRREQADGGVAIVTVSLIRIWRQILACMGKEVMTTS